MSHLNPRAMRPQSGIDHLGTFYALNTESTPIPRGVLVEVVGHDSGAFYVRRAQLGSLVGRLWVMVSVAPPSRTGIMRKMEVLEMNTVGAVQGDPVYLHDTIPGGMTLTKPGVAIQVGHVIDVGLNGTVFIEPKSSAQHTAVPSSGGGTKTLKVAANGFFKATTGVDGRWYNLDTSAVAVKKVGVYRNIAGTAGTTSVDVVVDGASVLSAPIDIAFGEGGDVYKTSVPLVGSTVPPGGYLSFNILSAETGAENLTLLALLE